MKVNGKFFYLINNVSLFQFLQDNKYEVSKIAIELNGNIIPKATYADIILQDDDTLEVVSFVGGG